MKISVDFNTLILFCLNFAGVGYCLYAVHPMFLAAYMIYNLSLVIESILDAVKRSRQIEESQHDFAKLYEEFKKSKKDD